MPDSGTAPMVNDAPIPQQQAMPMDNQQMMEPQGQDANVMDEPSTDTPDDKSEIQQMAGELSQLIRDYNSQLEEPDAETNKFAAGMVISAAIKNLDEKDRRDILKKLKAGDFDEVEGEAEPEAMPEDTTNPNDGEVAMEGILYTKKQIRG